MIIKFNEFLNESSDETITINFWGQYKGVFKKVNNGWKIVSGIFPDYIAKNIINDVDPEHDTEKQADIGITYKGYGLSPYFGEFAGGGYSPNKTMVISDELFNEISDDYNESVNESIDGVEKLSGGRVKYRNEIFPGFNKPKKYSGKGKYKKRVLAKEGDKIKIINYGHSDYEDYTKHKDSERRKNFRARHGCDPVSNLSKLTAKYWACQDLW